MLTLWGKEGYGWRWSPNVEAGKGVSTNNIILYIIAPGIRDCFIGKFPIQYTGTVLILYEYNNRCFKGKCYVSLLFTAPPSTAGIVLYVVLVYNKTLLILLYR
jgi:hypothetical protein